MGGMTLAQSLRYGYVTDPISHTMIASLADDIATQLNAADTARSTALHRPVGHARQVISSINLPVSTIVKIPFDQEIYDTHGMFNTGLNPTRITCTASAGAGVYAFNMLASCTTTSWVKGEYIFYKNGNFVCQLSALGPENVADHGHTALIDMIVTDFIECAVYHEGGGTTLALRSDMRWHKVSA